MAEDKKSTKQGGQQKNPFDFSEMFKMYDPERIAGLFDPQQFFAQMPALKSADLDIDAIIKRNQASYEAMVEANKAAAATYQDMLEKQMEIFNRMTQAAQAAAQDVQSPVDADAASKNAQVYTEAAQKAFELMREMAEAAQGANQQAFDRLSGQVTAAMDDLKKQ
ncbi:phasin family protein [Roseovarius salinarum]|uniref:phasin family protein n=1 Tax=Roseovarius salinarum TaxID=1981892 RepID=UPI000C32B3F0|nr:phasin family protein [Roseovarius salinarum]